MPNPDHVAILLSGVDQWNAWRSDHPEVVPDLSNVSVRLQSPVLGLNLNGINLAAANLQGADLYRCWLVNADLTGADLRGAGLGEVTAGGAHFDHAFLRGATLMKAHFYEATFVEADFVTPMAPEPEPSSIASSPEDWFWNKPALLHESSMECCRLNRARLDGAILKGVNLTDADLSEASLRNAQLDFLRLVRTRIQDADFQGARIQGLTAIDLVGTPRDESGLTVSDPGAYPIRLDFLEAAQFVPLLRSARLGHALDRLGPRTVLILGRFSEDRKPVLEALQRALTDKGWVALLFDFAAPKGITQTFKILAGLVGWVLVDVTDATEVRAEIRHVAKEHPRVPIQPILATGKEEWFGLEELRCERALIGKTFVYRDEQHLLSSLEEEVIAPARQRMTEVGRGG